MNGFDTLDWLVIGAYFLVLFGVAIWVILQRNRNTTDYFLAGRDIGWFVVGASIFASNIGSEHLVGLCGSAYDTGMVYAHYEIHAYLILLLGWIFVPYYVRSGVFTMPEFLEKRFSSRARWILSIISLVAYVFTKVAVTLYAGGVVFEALMGIDFWTGALAMLILTGAYTVVGGLRAVVYTEVVQTVVLIIGSIAITVIGLQKVGGWENLREAVGPDHLTMWKPLDDPKFPWPALLFGTPIVGFWYWCTDQYIVQRVLAARNITQARRGTIFGGYLKLLPIFIFMVPGLIALALSKSGQLSVASNDQAFPSLVMGILPSGLRGLVAGGLLAALMSSLSSVFNSCSTLFTVDIYQKLRPNVSQEQLVRAGRIATAVVVLCGVAWIPVVRGADQLYGYLQDVQAYVAPPISAIFVMGVFFKRVNSQGAVFGLLFGFIAGLLKIFIPLLMPDAGGIIGAFANFNFLYYCIIMFLMCCFLMYGISLRGEAPGHDKTYGLTYGSISTGELGASAAFSRWDVINSMFVVGLVVFVFWYFRG